MWRDGLVEEVRGLAPRMGRTASRAVGYAEVLALLAGRVDERAAREAVALGTRRLARKQMTWFGRDPRVHWLRSDHPRVLEQALDLVAAADAGRLDPPAGVRRTLGS
jgi:tRNA dimethylallyltransferase